VIVLVSDPGESEKAEVKPVISTVFPAVKEEVSITVSLKNSEDSGDVKVAPSWPILKFQAGEKLPKSFGLCAWIKYPPVTEPLGALANSIR
jgi:hypothetical protein